MDGDSDGNINSKPKEADSPNFNKSKGKRGQKNSGKKGKCSNCGKWGSHTAAECTATESPKKTEEANMASTGKSRSPGRMVLKIWDQGIMMIVTTKKIVCIFIKKITSRLWMFQAKTMPSMPITLEGHKSRNLVMSETQGQIQTQ